MSLNGGLSMNRFETSIGYRYARGKGANSKREKSSFIGVISKIAMFGIALGVMVLITVLSVVNGFVQTLKDSILSLAPHGAIYSTTGRLERVDDILAEADKHPNVNRATPYIQDYGMLAKGEVLAAVQIQGVDPSTDFNTMLEKDQIIAGDVSGMDSRKYQIVLGRHLANELNVNVDDKSVLLISQGTVTPAGIMPRMRRFTVAAIFEVGMHEYDKGIAFIHSADAARLFKMGDSFTRVRLHLDNPYIARDTVYEVAKSTNRLLYANDWSSQYGNLFRSVAVTKQILFLVMLLVVGVAVFNIVSTLMLVIDDKQSDIAILKTMGAKASQIMTIFTTQGVLIAIVGTLLGVVLGVLLSLNIGHIINGIESLFNIDLLADDVYLVSQLSGAIKWLDVLLIVLLTIGLAILATILPALNAARTEPASVLRHD